MENNDGRWGRRRNFEAGILTDDTALVAAAMDHLDSVWAGSTAIFLH